MASNVPVKLLLLAALVATTAASGVDRIKAAGAHSALTKTLTDVNVLSSYSQRDARAMSQGGRKLLFTQLQQAQKPGFATAVSEGTKNVASAVLSTPVGGRKLTRISDLASSFKQTAKPAAKTFTQAGTHDRKLMTSGSGVVSQAPTKVGNGLTFRKDVIDARVP